MFVDPSKPEKGIKYLYLDEEGYLDLVRDGSEYVKCEKIEQDGETIYRIDSIVGKEHGIGYAIH